MMIFEKLITWWRSLRYYVIADPSDNSVTLSKHLFYHMKKCAENSGVAGASVFVFRIPQGGTFGFMINPEITEPTQLCQIQYNGKYRCVGFETLCPSVGRIFYEYGLPALRPVKLSVSVRHTPQGKTYYRIDVPRHRRGDIHVARQSAPDPVASENAARRGDILVARQSASTPAAPENAGIQNRMTSERAGEGRP